MIQFSATLYGTLEYKPLALNGAWGFQSGKGPACISNVSCGGEAGQKPESWHQKAPGSFLLPSTPLQPPWLTPKAMAGAEHCFSLRDIPGSRRTHPCGIGTQATFPFPLHNSFPLMSFKLKQNPEDLLPCLAHYIGFMRVWSSWAWWQDGYGPETQTTAKSIQEVGRLFALLSLWAFSGFGFFLPYLLFHPQINPESFHVPVQECVQPLDLE